MSCVCDVWLIQCRSYTIWCVARGVVLVLWIFPCVLRMVAWWLFSSIGVCACNLLFIFKWPSFPVCVFNLDKPVRNSGTSSTSSTSSQPATSITTITTHGTAAAMPQCHCKCLYLYMIYHILADCGRYTYIPYRNMNAATTSIRPSAAP